VSYIRDWEERKYREVFDQTVSQLETRRLTDPTFTCQEAQGLLEAAYVDQGNDYIGRGGVVEIVQAATIAAYERILDEWPGQGGGADRE
jgi:hypothetical protein